MLRRHRQDATPLLDHFKRSVCTGHALPSAHLKIGSTLSRCWLLPTALQIHTTPSGCSTDMPRRVLRDFPHLNPRLVQLPAPFWPTAPATSPRPFVWTRSSSDLTSTHSISSCSSSFALLLHRCSFSLLSFSSVFITVHCPEASCQRTLPCTTLYALARAHLLQQNISLLSERSSRSHFHRSFTYLLSVSAYSISSHMSAIPSHAITIFSPVSLSLVSTPHFSLPSESCLSLQTPCV